jgi:hypothetical protein
MVRTPYLVCSASAALADGEVDRALFLDVDVLLIQVAASSPEVDPRWSPPFPELAPGLPLAVRMQERA